MRREYAVATPRRPVTVTGLVAAFILVIFVATPETRPQQAYMSAGRVTPPPEAAEIALLVGRSTLLTVDRPIERVSLTTPDIADALVTSPQQILIHGKSPGTISLFVWDRAGGIKSYEISVRRDLSALMQQLTQLFPGEPISVAGSGKDVVLSGTVSSKYVVEKAADVAGGYVEKKENVVNLLRQMEGVASNQVMLRVRFAEVSRSAMQELGVSFFTGPGGYKDYVARVTTQQFPAPDFDTREGGLTFSDYLNLLVFNTKEQLGGVIKALSEKGLFQSLAEPNLIASNGREASFLAGGEFPFPVLQASTAGNAITIQFKEFGIRLTFTPTILQDDLVHLKVRPEVSSLDFNSSLTIEGFRIPAISTRRTETEVELRNGQTFAIAGLLNNSVTETMRKIPGIGDIPILGYLFRSRAYQKQQTELVVMITPQILRRDSVGVAPAIPNLAQPFLPPIKTPLPPPPPYAPKGDDMPAAMAAPSGQAVPATTPKAAPATAGQQEVPLPPQQFEPRPVTPAAQASPAELQQAAEGVRKAEEQAEKARREQDKQDAEAAKRAAAQAEKQRKEEEKLAREQAKKDAEAAKRAAAEAEKQRQEQEKAAKAQAKKDAEATKRAAELAKKREKEEQDRARALAEAEARLREAQAAYQAEVKKQTKPGGGGEPR